jgi:IS5 family transposase
MDGELLRWLYQRLVRDPTCSHTRNCTYGDGLVALVYFFGVLNDRSVLWASDKRHWPLWCRRLKLPGRSQTAKRLRTPSLRQLIEQINAQLQKRLPHGQHKVVDGKPLVVSNFSHDPDARRGRCAGGFGRGYKLHVLIDAIVGVIERFVVTPLNAGESRVLRDTLVASPMNAMTLRADANYDSNPAYRAVAAAGGRLIAPRRKPGRGISRSHRQHPDRLAAIDLLETDPAALADHERQRNRVEQTLAHLTNLPFGLAPLPNFVRRLHRVRLWVMAKITLYHLHLTLRNNDK